jgi:hypothetical protein
MIEKHGLVISALGALFAAAPIAAQNAARTAEDATRTAIALVQSIDQQIHAVIAIDPTALD